MKKYEENHDRLLSVIITYSHIRIIEMLKHNWRWTWFVSGCELLVSKDRVDTKTVSQKNNDMVFFENNRVWFRNNGLYECNGHISKDFLYTLSYNLNCNPLAFFAPVSFSRVCLEIKSIKYKLSSKKVFPLKYHTRSETTMRKKKVKETLTNCEAEESFLHSPAKT